jgi:hypothetical protein
MASSHQTLLACALFFCLLGSFLPAIEGALVPISPSGDCGTIFANVGAGVITPFGVNGSTCIANAVTGLKTSVEGYTYYLRAANSGVLAPIGAYVYDLDGQTVVASSATLSSLPTDVASPNFTAVQATFPSPLTLQANSTYYFAFCFNATKTVGYHVAHNHTAGGNAFSFCQTDFASCVSSTSAWTVYMGDLRMDISSKPCPAPSSASTLSSSSFLALAQAWAYLRY